MQNQKIQPLDATPIYTTTSVPKSFTIFQDGMFWKPANMADRGAGNLPHIYNQLREARGKAQVNYGCPCRVVVHHLTHI